MKELKSYIQQTLQSEETKALARDMIVSILRDSASISSATTSSSPANARLTEEQEKEVSSGEVESDQNIKMKKEASNPKRRSAMVKLLDKSFEDKLQPHQTTSVTKGEKSEKKEARATTE